ncbi:coiled-coil protein [Trema orientale]|uniref:Coiled-coil protein n=1 Tax=Trema orientale TaxID=63057 RepID=A0A2P5FZ78_TREOI|nr:coiled-coil protein [Trema orientale]
MRTTTAARNEGMESIAERLSGMEDLYFPRAIQATAINPSQRKLILLDLLSRDVPVFLERYGPKLTSEELGEFDALKDNYEINWHLNHLRSVMSPTSDELRSKSVTVKNRRRAYLDKLICEGQYFSEDAMREREPYLHHEYLGKFQDLSGRSMARPGERWSETLLRRSEEAILVAKIRGEQQRLGVAERDWIGFERNQQEEEEEEEDDDDDDDDEEEDEKEEEESKETRDSESAEIPVDHHNSTNGVQITTAGHSEQPSLSPLEMQDQMDQFTYIMQQKFLLGEDHEYLDYSKIDNDETLDDHWQREANYDAEEKYFAED